MSDDLEDRFRDAMRDRYLREIPRATGLRLHRIVEMIERRGGVETARALMAQYPDHSSDGYTKLWEAGRLDLTFEALMLKPEFLELFTDREITWACEGLERGL